MQLSDLPTLVPLPFANSGTKNVIPTASQIGITAGAASLTDGFPPLTFTPIAAGGVPPAGADFNGILNLLSANTRWDNAGGFYPYSSTFSTSIGGYPKGAILSRVDATGFWLSTADNNTLNPETDTSGAWVPINNNGATTLTLSSTNVTLTALEYAKDTIVLTGTLLANVQIIFPNTIPYRRWNVINNTTGAFTVTCKTSAGTGITISSGGEQDLYSDGTNIVGYIGNANQHLKVGPATEGTDAVQLIQVATGGGSSNSGTATLISTNVSFTPETNALILVNSTVGAASGIPQPTITVSGGTILYTGGNYTTGLGAANAVIRGVAGTPITITATNTNSVSAAIAVTLTYMGFASI